jgi:hypothetical protein
MHFALLGDHADGLDITRALVESGRHQLAAYSGPTVGVEYLRGWGVAVQAVGDLEEILADPAIEAVIVAGKPGDRVAQLRRALQSERHVLCVHPADQAPDVAHEALLIQGDTGQVLLPLLTEALHPAVPRLAALARSRFGTPGSEAGLQPVWLLEIERASSEQVLLDADTPGHRPGLPGWEVLRRVGGEVVELSAFAAGEEITAEEPLLLAGRFDSRGLFRATLLPQQPEARWRLTLTGGTYGRAELLFPHGWPGPARLAWQDETGQERQESWESWNPWPALVEVFEAAVEHHKARGPGDRTPPTGPLTWTDEIRALELDDAVRRSVARRRTSTLEYQTATEEASFKGTMTLLGCSLLWASLALLILSVWVPWAGWLIAPLFALFLALQLFRWALPAREQTRGGPANRR